MWQEHKYCKDQRTQHKIRFVFFYVEHNYFFFQAFLTTTYLHRAKKLLGSYTSNFEKSLPTSDGPHIVFLKWREAAKLNWFCRVEHNLRESIAIMDNASLKFKYLVRASILLPFWTESPIWTTLNNFWCLAVLQTNSQFQSLLFLFCCKKNKGLSNRFNQQMLNTKLTQTFKAPLVIILLFHDHANTT